MNTLADPLPPFDASPAGASAVDSLVLAETAFIRTLHPMLQLVVTGHHVSLDLLALQSALLGILDQHAGHGERLRSLLALDPLLEPLGLPQEMTRNALIALHDQFEAECVHPVGVERALTLRLASLNMEVLRHPPMPPQLRRIGDGSLVAPGKHFNSPSFRPSIPLSMQRLLDAIDHQLDLHARLLDDEDTTLELNESDDAIADSSPHPAQRWGRSSCAAALRVLQLHLVYNLVEPLSLRERESEADQDRLIYFSGPGLALWNRLLGLATREGPLRGSEEEQIGLPAQRMMLRTLQGAVDVARLKAGRLETASAGALHVSEVSPDGPYHLVIAGTIPASTNREDREALSRFEVLRSPLPLAVLPDAPALEGLIAKLHQEFPWAHQAVSAIADELQVRRAFGSPAVGMAPLLLVGAPGCGKSRLARRVSELLGLPFMAVSVGGTSDGKSLCGTSRGWSSGQASPLVELMRMHRLASAVVLLDEIEKAGTTSTNGVPVLDVLLGLLEPENARRWWDTYLQTACDVSPLVFIGTANRVDALPRPLLSRMDVLLVPSPGPGHHEVIVRSVVRDLARDWQLPDGVLPELDWRPFAERAGDVRALRAELRRAYAQWARAHLGPTQRH